jgi:hypothetical protein
MNRDEIDEIAWKSIGERTVQKRLSAPGSRPMTFLDFECGLAKGGDIEHVWGDLPYAFFDYRDASFFEFPSPPSLSVGWQAILAASAEWLSAESGLPKTRWVDDPHYLLSEGWDPMEDLGLDLSDFIAAKLSRSPEAFRRRNIAFLSRNLITL